MYLQLISIAAYLALASALLLDFDVYTDAGAKGFVKRDLEELLLLNSDLAYVVDVNGHKVRLDTFRSDLLVITDQTECIRRKGIQNNCKSDVDNLDHFTANRSAPALVWPGPDQGGISVGQYGSGDVKVGDIEVKDFTYAWARKTTESLGVLGVGLPENESTNLHENENDHKDDHNNQNQNQNNRNNKRDRDDDHRYIYENFPMKLKADGKISKNMFAIWQDGNSGKIKFGEGDKLRYSGDLTEFSMANSNRNGRYTYMPLKNVQLDGQDIVQGNRNQNQNRRLDAILEAGSAYSLFPGDIVLYLGWKLTGQRGGNWNEGFDFDCSKKDQTVTFDFGSVKYDLKVEDLMQQKGSQCHMPVSWSQRDDVILGNNFLKNFYVEVDQEDHKVRIAKRLDLVSLSAGSGSDSSDSSDTAARTTDGGATATGDRANDDVEATTTATSDSNSRTLDSASTVISRTTSASGSAAAAAASGDSAANGATPLAVGWGVAAVGLLLL